MTKRSNTFLFFCLLVVFIFCSLGFANRDNKKTTSGLTKPTVENQFTLSGNNWAFEMTNYGSYAQDLEGRLPGGGSGGEFPKGTGTYVIFAAGIQIGAMVSGVPKVSAVEFDSEFQPGALLKTNAKDSNEVPTATAWGDAVNKVFALYKDGSDGTPVGTNGDDMDDFSNWPSQYGAPTKADGSPLVIGDLMSWCVYNDMDRNRHKVPDDSQKDPLGLEVQQASIQVNIAGYNDVFFMYYKIINKGTQNLSDVYIAAWFDADVDKSANDLVATDTVRAIPGTSDTVRNMVFTYNSDNTDPVSGGGSAYGADFFQGPVVPGDPTDVAKYLELTQDGFVQREVLGKKVLGLSATVRYINVRGPSGDPDNDAELYNLMKGLEKNGDAKANIYAYPADPLTTASGDPNLDPTPDDKRMMLSTGPFNLAVGDTQIVVLACVGGKGTDKDDAVKNLRLTDVIAQKAYDNKFILPPPPPSPNLTATPLNGKVILQWDDSPELNEDRYPELVNVTIPGYITRDFAGYKVYRSPSGTVGTWTLLAQYDKKDGITTIPETTWVTQDVSIKEIKIATIGDDKGLRYTYTDETVTNEQQYYYAVTSYDAQPYIRSGAAPITLESSHSENSVRTVPRDATLGNLNTASAMSTADHTGPSDGSVAITVIDPTKVTGDSYKIEFENVQVVDTVNAPTDTTTQLMWKLYDVTKSAYAKFLKGDDANTNIDESYYQTNQASETDAASLELFTLVDGLKIQMFGPPNGMKDYGIPNGERKWTWVGGDYFALEGFSGAMGWGGSWTDNIGYSSVAPDEIRNVLIKLATTDSNGVFDPADTNV